MYEINERITSFSYGYHFKFNKPSSLNIESMSMSATECWCLIIHFPFIFYDIISQPIYGQKYLAFVKLLKIINIVFSKKIELSEIQKLKE